MNLANRQKLIVILGTTSSGKTALARELCKEFDGYIISADSRQVYRYMDIGTGKADTVSELLDMHKQREVLDRLCKHTPDSRFYILNSISHYMIDIVKPSQEYNVVLYQRDVYNLLSSKLKAQSAKPQRKTQIFSIPFLVGGTGQYIDAVVDNWQFPEGEPNDALRREIEERVKTEGLEVLWEELTARDPECAQFVQKENPRRVARALEYVLSTGKKFSTGRRKGERRFDVLKIGISLPREELYKKIDARVFRRLAVGMVEEVWELHTKHRLSFERLRQFGLEYRIIGEWLKKFKTKNLKLKTTGKNKTLILYSMKEMSQIDGYQDMVQKLKWAIHDYARRQLTWFRRDKEVRWVSCPEDASRFVGRFIL